MKKIVLENFEDLKDCTLSAVEQINDELVFTLESGDRYALFYEPDCCASCSIEDIAGDLEDLVGSPITQAEENSSNETPEDREKPEYEESFTWTFYRIATAKGLVVIRWYGSSNGYYSESVSWGKR